MVKVSLVSYLNSLPFKWGLENYVSKPEFDLSFDYPAECARKLVAGEINVGLVPVAIIPEVKNAQIISPFGIAANGKVDSVLLVSNVSFNRIKTIWLDYQSKSSIFLLKVLLQNYWKSPHRDLKAAPRNYLEIMNEDDAAVVIGDRALEKKVNYKYVWDLAEEWKNFTNLPFVFAAWVSNVDLTENWIKNFNNALKYGIENLHALAESSPSLLPKQTVTDYLINKIKYQISSDPYQQAIAKFLKLKSDLKGY